MIEGQTTSNNLIELIRESKWNDIHQYLHEAKYPDSSNIYALHEICCDPEAPIEIVINVYNMYPKASLIQINEKYSPLYNAVEAGFEEAVNFLANTCPETCTVRTSYGSTPLLSAIYKLNRSNIIDSIILANLRAVFIKDEEGDSAFDIFFRIWNVFVRIALHDQFEFNHDHTFGHGNWTKGDIYDKACLFLKAANVYQRKRLLDNKFLLHVALREESCHWAFCKLLIKLHPEQVLTRDKDENLPIHIITAAKDKSDENTFLCYDCFMTKSNLVNIEYLNGRSEYCCEECFSFKPEETIKQVHYIRPGKKCNLCCNSLKPNTNYG